MDNLRWVLLVIGMLIILLVYVFSRFNLFERLGKRFVPSASSMHASPRDRREPTAFAGDIDIADEHDDVAFHVSEFSAEIPSVHHEPDEEPHSLTNEEWASDWHDSGSTSTSSSGETDIESTRITSAEVPVLDEPIVQHAAEPPVLKPAEAAHLAPSKPTPPVQDTLPLDMQPLVLVLTVMASEGSGFQGEQLVRALEGEGLAFGDMDIFHYCHDGRQPPVFSVANVLEPGIFDVSGIANLSTPGITLFAQLPGVLAPDEAFDCMLQRARNIAGQLHGRVCDDRRNALTSQRITHYRDRIAAFNRELMLARRA